MLDLTDRHARFLLRRITRHALLYSEMITTGALLHGDAERLLRFDPSEHPLALQLGGSDPTDLARAARMASDHGYDEVNLNVGCPSDRVQSGRFGACLMAEPALVADGVAAMTAASSLPVTVKTRIGIDRDASTDRLVRLVDAVRQAGCRTFIVHARNAWLDGLSPKENREIPPLRYEVVYALKRDWPELEIVINGGIRTIDESLAHLEHVNGVMLGRAAYYRPWLLSQVDTALYGAPAPVDRQEEVVETYLPYLTRELSGGTPLVAMTRHLLGLFHGGPGARAWRRMLSEDVHRATDGVALVRQALDTVAAARLHFDSPELAA